MLRRAVRARVEADGGQVVDVTIDAGYHPDTIVARAGLPLRLVFRRDDADACSERVVFSAAGLDRRLAPFGATTVDLPARPPGQVRFTCGMGRYRGRIELVDDRAPSIVGRVRNWAPGFDLQAGAWLSLWLCLLPLIALAAVLLVDGAGAVIAVGATVVAWLVIWAWTITRSAPSS